MNKIVFVNTSLTSGGSERVMSMLAGRLAELGNDVTMLLIRDGLKPQYSVSSRLNVIQFRYKTKNKLSVLFQRYFMTRKVIREQKPDVVISFMWDVNAFTILSCLFLPVTLVVSERADPGSARTRKGLRWFTENVLYRLADRVVVQTDYVKKYYPNKVIEKCVVIPNPVNPSLPFPYEGQRYKEVIAAGRMTEQKNFGMLLAAFAKFQKTHGDWKITIYGEGPLREKLAADAHHYGLDDAVRFPGFVPDLAQKMWKAGIYASSSNYEGISNVMLEALSMGIPSVCTDCPVGGASLAIQDGVNGLLVPVGDDKAMTEALCRLADESGLAERLESEAPKVRETFSIDRICELWMLACNCE